MTPRQKTATALLIVNGFIVTFLVVAFLSLIYYGSWLEAETLGYVIDIPKPSRLYRGYITKRESGREVEVGCFDFDKLRKVANAKPYKEAFVVQTIQKITAPGSPAELVKYSDSIPVSVYTAGAVDHQQIDDFRIHKAGAVWERAYCFEMPGTIADSQHLLISGSLQHHRMILGEPNKLWRSVAPVQAFELLPTRCYSPDPAARSSEECKSALPSP